jgi:hypothetical protein
LKIQNFPKTVRNSLKTADAAEPPAQYLKGKALVATHLQVENAVLLDVLKT